jgi:exocyst complex component 4
MSTARSQTAYALIRVVRFIFSGLEPLMENLLISNSRYIRLANSYGIKKIFRNIMALRQSLKTMSSYPVDAEFEKARRYYDLYAIGPEVSFIIMACAY